MKIRELAVEGALECTPQVFSDDRGITVAPLQEPALVEATGRPFFHVAQTLHSTSRRGVVRGVHYTPAPPGMAKYVHCVRGAALDIVLDTRVGSPTFGEWDSVLLDEQHFRSVYLPVGVGHAFVALHEDTTISYLLSESYVPEREEALSVFDPDLGLPIPDDITPLLSKRDRTAPTLAKARAKGRLVDYTTCRRIERAARGTG